MSKVLVCPDSFKGTMTSSEVAHAISLGVRDAKIEVIEIPISDGGEGFLRVFMNRLPHNVHETMVTNSVGNQLIAKFITIEKGTCAVIETAQVCGLQFARPTIETSLIATTKGVGELIISAVKIGVKKIILGVGGTATTDGGLGAIDYIEELGGLNGIELVVLSDVTTVFEDAARIFAPQKGANAAAVLTLSERLLSFSRRLPKNPCGVAGSGAGGGIAGGFWAMYDAEICSGIEQVLKLIDIDEIMAHSDLVITGEGRLDRQSMSGKVVSGVLEHARSLEKPTWAFVGQNRLSTSEVADFGLAGVKVATNIRELRLAGAELAANYFIKHDSN
jgi:glycerate kinase